MTNRRTQALASGLLIAAGLPPWGWGPLALLGIAIWFRLVRVSSARHRFGLSAIVGLAWATPATLWMVDLTAPGWPIAVLIFAALTGVIGAATPADDGWTRRCAFVGALVLIELLRWNYPFGGTPIATYAMIGVGTPWALSARLFGSPLLAGLVALAGVGVADLFERRWLPALGIATALALGTIGGNLAGNATKTIGTIDVAVVQGGGPQNTRADICETRAVFERHMEASASIDRRVDLVLWPEDVVHPAPDERPTPDRCTDPLLGITEATERLTQHAADVDAVVISGWFRRTDDGRANANYSIAQSPDGTVTDRYDKVRLVPFGEFVPLRSMIERFSDELPSRDVRPGTEPAVLDTDIGRFGVVISWEVFFDHRARDAIGNGGQALLNPTNGSSYWLTIVQTQQVASSRLRAIETDRWVLQAAPTGFSAVVHPDGHVEQRTAISEQKVLYDTIELRSGTTLAVRWGAWPMIVFGVVALAVAWRPGRTDSHLDQERDRPVIDQSDRHLGPEASGLDDGTTGP